MSCEDCRHNRDAMADVLAQLRSAKAALEIEMRGRALIAHTLHETARTLVEAGDYVSRQLKEGAPLDGAGGMLVIVSAAIELERLAREMLRTVAVVEGISRRQA